MGYSIHKIFKNTVCLLELCMINQIKEEVPADIASEVMSGTLTDWDRIYQNKMIPSENGQGLEILSGQIRVLHMCVTRWKKHEKEYRNKARYEQILSLAEECGYTDLL